MQVWDHAPKARTKAHSARRAAEGGHGVGARLVAKKPHRRSVHGKGAKHMGFVWLGS
jgi:hypothetical protein